MTIARIRTILYQGGGIMDVLIKLSVPNFIYRFYKDASRHVAGSTPEKLMSDALSAYAGLLSKDIARQRTEYSDKNSSASRSR